MCVIPMCCPGCHGFCDWLVEKMDKDKNIDLILDNSGGGGGGGGGSVTIDVTDGRTPGTDTRR